MANPPVTIGPFTNVPAPGSPIRSDWAQSISTYVSKLSNIRSAIGAAAIVNQGVPIDPACNFGTVPAGTYLVVYQVGWGAPEGGTGDHIVTADLNAGGTVYSSQNMTGRPGTLWMLTDLTIATSMTVKITLIKTSSGQLQTYADARYHRGSLIQLIGHDLV